MNSRVLNKKHIFIIGFILFNAIFNNALGQNFISNKIKEIEVYGLEYDRLYIANIDKDNLKKRYSQYVRVKSEEKINESFLGENLNSLEISLDNDIPQDYRAILVVHYTNSKKEIYYIASAFAGIVKDKTLYKNNKGLIASIYSFFPDYYFIK